MGMFDYVDIGDRLRCPSCNTPLAGWQTKDSPGQLLDTYRVRPDGIVERVPLNYEGELPEPAVVVPADFCGVWEIYTDCDRCRKPPEAFQAELGLPGYSRVRVEAQIVIVDGRLHRLKTLSTEED